MAELVDAVDSKSTFPQESVSSSLTRGTIRKNRRTKSSVTFVL